MGSFYGTTFQELKETFKKLIVKDHNKNKMPIIAKGVEDSITFESKDQWIVLEGDDNKQTIFIEHGKAPQFDGEVTETLFVTDPIIQPEINELKPGQVFYVNSFEHDAKGHKTRHRTSGFKLPQTDAEVELESIKSRLDDLEFQDQAIIQEFANYATTDQQEINEERLADLESFQRDTVPNTYATKEETGSVTEMKNSTAYDKYTSIAALIGNIEELNAELGFNPDKRALTLSEALMEILPKIQAELETLPYTFQGIKGQISELEDRIQQLEDK